MGTAPLFVNSNDVKVIDGVSTIVTAVRRGVMGSGQSRRRELVSEHKRELILAAAKDVFAEQGLEGASLRAIAVRAGYTPAALYFHFDSKEAIYAELLKASLASLGDAVVSAVAAYLPPPASLREPLNNRPRSATLSRPIRGFNR